MMGQVLTTLEFKLQSWSNPKSALFTNQIKIQVAIWPILLNFGDEY